MKEFCTTYFLFACIAYASPQVPAHHLVQAGTPRYGALTRFITADQQPVRYQRVVREMPDEHPYMYDNSIREACYFGFSRYGNRRRLT